MTEISSTLTRGQELGPAMQKPTDLLDTVFDLYGYLPHDNDSRWPFLIQYHFVRTRAPFKPLNFANARNATYLSDELSFASGFVTTALPENQLQLRRALDNLASRNDVEERFEASGTDFEAYNMRLALTDRLTAHSDQPASEITPCPEALHQVRLFDRGQYLARVGFNVHGEIHGPVVSIVNIQGTPGGQERNGDFKETYGVSPFNVLVKRVADLAEAGDRAFQVRGLVNPARGSSQLYWGVLSSEGVSKYHAGKNPAQMSEAA